MLNLSSKELAYANEQLLRRRDDRKKSLSVCRAMLVGKEGLKEFDVGKLKEGKTLKEQLDQLDKRQRQELCEAYSLFREASQQ